MTNITRATMGKPEQVPPTDVCVCGGIAHFTHMRGDSMAVYRCSKCGKSYFTIVAKGKK